MGAGRRALLLQAALLVVGAPGADAAPVASRATLAVQPAPWPPQAVVPRVLTVLPEPVRALIDATGLPLESFGLLVESVSRPRDAGAPRVSLNAEQLFKMASTVKLVTALAALDLLGPDFQWHTRARLEGTLVDGRLLGDLVIVGGGDPALNADQVLGWFKEMRDRGLREIWGDMVLDRSAFQLDEGDHRPTPSPTPDQPRWARPDALMLNAGVLRVEVQSSVPLASNQKQAPRVTLHPRQAGLPVQNRMTSGQRCIAEARFEGVAGEKHLVIKGEWASACGDREVAQLLMPHSELAGRAVAELWRACGGRLKGRVRRRAAENLPPPALHSANGSADAWATLSSPPLAELVRTMNKLSDNLIARTMLLSLASDFPSRPATLPGALSSVTDWMHGQGLMRGDIHVDNGAGLSAAERGKPRALNQLLRNAWHGRHGHLFARSLPVAGMDGTLWRRMTSGPAAGRAFLKTGSGLETRALAGYVHGKSGRVQGVTAFVNHRDAAAALDALDAIIEWVVLTG